MSEKRDAYVEKLKAKLDEWNADIDVLQARADQAKTDAQLRYRRQIEGLRAKSKDAEAKISELRVAGGDAWEDLKAGANIAWTALGEAVTSAKARFKS